MNDSAILCRIDAVTCSYCYRADGTIDRDQGDGWKPYKKLKAGIDPVDAAKRAEATFAKKLAAELSYAEFRKLVHQACEGHELFKRAIVLEAIRLLGNDVDGLWSELNDTAGISISYDEAQQLVWAHKAMITEAIDIEGAKIKAEKSQVKS